jgi:Mrp family chromosome partitioning ATPase/capsular polysaccharide biosynthesis protein
MVPVTKFDPQLQAHGFTADDLILDVTASTSTTAPTISVLATASHPADAVLIANDVARGFADYIRAQSQAQLDVLRANLTKQISIVQADKKKWEQLINALPGNTAPGFTVDSNNLTDDTHNLDTLMVQQQALPSGAINGDVQVIQSVALKDVTTSPKGLIITAVTGGVGLFVGILVMLLLIYLDHRLRNFEQVNEKLGLAYVGSLPKSRDLQRTPIQVAGTLAQELSDICANLRLTGILPGTWQVPQGAVLLVTSPQEAEGKTTLVAAIAAAVASTGSKVVVVDGNLQQPSTHLAFQMRPVGIGLSGLLKGNGSEVVDDAVVRSTIPGVWLLPAGTPTDNGALLLGQRFPGIVKQLLQKADLIIIDGPALLSSANASQLATVATGVALVVDVRYAKFPLLQRATNLLGSLTHTPTGIILNRSISRGRNSYYAATYAGNATPEQEVAGQVHAGHGNGLNNGHRREPEIAAPMAMKSTFTPSGGSPVPPGGPSMPGYPASSPSVTPPEVPNVMRDLRSQQLPYPFSRGPQ